MKIAELLVEDQTIPDLRRSIERGFPHTKKRQHATDEVNVTKLQYTPIGNNTLRLTSNTQSDNGHKYQQIIDLKNINYEPDGHETTEITDIGGNKHTVTAIELNVNNVAVYCSCQDYQMRFAYYNIQNNCHVGPPPKPYVRKTDYYPPANPLKVPGCCKHILKVEESLKDQGILR
jgi:hypothetical protein